MTTPGQWVLIAIMLAGPSMLGPGCGPSTPTTQPAERGEAALQDPMNYKPTFHNRSVSGGDITSFDKDEFNRDVQHVLNP